MADGTTDQLDAYMEFSEEDSRIRFSRVVNDLMSLKPIKFEISDTAGTPGARQNA